MRRLGLALILLLAFASTARAQTFVGTPQDCSQVSGNAAPGITCNNPTGLQNNDLILFGISYYQPTPATPTMPGGTVVAYDSPANGFDGGVIMWKCASSEGSTETVTTGSGVMQGQGKIWALRGTICPTNPIDVSAGGSHGNGTTLTIPALAGTTATANELAFQLGGVTDGTVSTYTNPAGTTIVGSIINSNTGQQFGLGVSYKNFPSSGSTVGSLTGSLGGTAVNWVGLQFTVKALVAAITQQSVCPGGATVAGTCKYPPTTVQGLTFQVCPAGLTCTSIVTDATATCAPGTAPSSGGSNPCDVAWTGSAWLED